MNTSFTSYHMGILLVMTSVNENVSQFKLYVQLDEGIVGSPFEGRADEQLHEGDEGVEDPVS